MKAYEVNAAVYCVGTLCVVCAAIMLLGPAGGIGAFGVLACALALRAR
jgi:hypothetical protein